jgi:ABC-type phosphate/phosphonate transport system substrate-binding protein
VGATHRAFFVVPATSSAQSLADLRGGVFLLNSPVSNSGMNLPRRALAEIADDRKFFCEIIVTGGHPASLERLLRGEGDVASIDCVTYAFWRHYRPDAAQSLRIVAETPPSPAIPFVTSVATPADTVEVLRAALRILLTEPRYIAVRRGLMIAGIEDLPDSAYRGLLDYEREAVELGYPQLV